jgi:L-methionine (R)-S-oxide reductase
MNPDYQLLVKQAEALISSESDPIANAANLSSLLYNNLENVNWVGFYFLRDEELVLGPFSGQPACTRIGLGKGVCGSAFNDNKTYVVKDVHQFPGHIACDAASESEIVVPFKTNTLSGVFDIDSPVHARFGEEEQELFEQVCALYVDRLTNT